MFNFIKNLFAPKQTVQVVEPEIIQPPKPKRKLTINREEVKNTNVSFINDYPIYRGISYHTLREHYKLLTYLSYQFDNEIIIDGGTNQGLSAFCLSRNMTNKVLSYDIIGHDIPYKRFAPNVEFKIQDINKEDKNFIKSTYFILFDLALHNGDEELIFLKTLEEIKYDGFVLWDDINLNDGMRNFWRNIKQQKVNLTDIGHWSGTGLTAFGNTEFEII